MTRIREEEEVRRTAFITMTSKKWLKCYKHRHKHRCIYRLIKTTPG